MRSIPPTINPEPGLSIQPAFIEEATTDGSLVYPELNDKITFHQLFLKAMNMVGPFQCLLV